MSNLSVTNTGYNSEIVFDSDANTNGTSLMGYLYHDYTFEEVVARLASLVHYDIFTQGDGYKLSFCISGTYKDKPFTLYDWKCDNGIHIGGRDDLDVSGLQKALIKILKNTEPKPYTATYHYDEYEGQTYSWP